MDAEIQILLMILSVAWVLRSFSGGDRPRYRGTRPPEKPPGSRAQPEPTQPTKGQ